MNPRTVGLVAATALAQLVIAGGLAGCKPKGERATLGPLTGDRYEAATVEGGRLDCYVFGADSNKPVRLCGDGTVAPGNGAVLFKAVAPAPGGKFASALGEPGPPGVYLLRALGAAAVDAWGLGSPPLLEWLAGGKVLLAVEGTPDKRTRVRLVDPAGRAERTLDAGITRGDTWNLLRADGDVALLLVQRLGGEELISVAGPATNNPELTVADASEDKLPGNRRYYKRGDLDRLNGGVFKPSAAVMAAFKWESDKWTFEGAELGPFATPSK